MPAREFKMAALVLGWCGVLAAGALAAYYSQVANSANTSLQQARDEIVELRQRLLVQRPNSPNVMLDYDVDDPDPEPILERTLTVTAPESDEASNRIRDLEATLAMKDRQLSALQPAVSNAPPRPPRDPQAWLEDLKTREPERYAMFVKYREEQHQQVRDAFAKSAAHLLENDAGERTETEQQERQVMLSLVNETWKMAEQLYNNPPPDDRWELMQTMRQNLDTLRPMLETERTRALRQLGVESGYTPAEAAVFVDYVNSVFESTSIRPLQRALRRGHGPGLVGWGGGGPPNLSAPPPPGGGGQQR